MRKRLFDWTAIQSVAANQTPSIVRLSPDSLALFLSTADLTVIEQWRVGDDEPDFAQRDAIEAMTAQAYYELMGNPMLGTIFAFATATPPDGALECDGTAYARTDYPDLYALLDSAFIVDADNFIVPDLRGRVVIAAGSGTGLSSYAPADTGGEEAHQLTSAELAVHSHAVTDLGHAHNEIIAAPNATTIGPGAPQPTAVPAPGVTGIATTGISINNAGADAAHENRQPYFALRAAIWAI